MTILYSIYYIKNQITNKFYIGFTAHPENRKKQHFCYYNKKSYSSRSLLYEAMRKYGIENFTFEVIYQSWDLEDCLKIMEPKFIREYNSFAPSGYNLTSGGDGSIGYKHTEKEILELKRTKKIWATTENGRKTLLKMTEKSLDVIRKRWLIVFPDGKEEIINNLPDFCKIHDLSYRGIRKVIIGKRKHYRQFRVYYTDRPLPINYNSKLILDKCGRSI